MNALKNSYPMSRQELCEIADWIEEDISGMSNREAYDYLIGQCELMYSELIRVIAGKKSDIYPELNTYDDETLNKCKGAICFLNIELGIGYPEPDKKNA